MKRRNTRQRRAASKGSSPVDPSAGNGELHVQRMPHPLFGPPPAIVETVRITRVGHTFGPLPPLVGSGYIVQDFLLDQTGASGTDGKMAATHAFDLTQSTSFRFNVLPSAQTRRIAVKPPIPKQVYIGFGVGRRFAKAVSDVSDAFSAHAFFTQLNGISPTITYRTFFIGRNTNHWAEFVVEGHLTQPMSFKCFTTIGVYPARTFDPGSKVYVPFSSGLPINLPGPDSVPYLMFSYLTQSSIDPGPFVFIS
jgi:hypothetical protein